MNRFNQTYSGYSFARASASRDTDLENGRNRWPRKFVVDLRYAGQSSILRSGDTKPSTSTSACLETILIFEQPKSCALIANYAHTKIALLGKVVNEQGTALHYLVILWLQGCVLSKLVGPIGDSAAGRR